MPINIIFFFLIDSKAIFQYFPRVKHALLLFSYFFLFPSSLFAQTDSLRNNSFYKPNIDEISKLPRLNKSEPSISIASFTQTTLRESPSIVTLITNEEIRKMGAKDILDVLRLVPGFDVALDIQPVLTVRGNGANEAKILVQIDGHIINDISFGYITLGQRVPLQTIDRIEIIRGSGSAIYGGMAGLAVVNIITKKATTGQIIGASSQIGFTKNNLMRNNLEFWALQKFNNGIEFSLIAGRNSGKTTDRNYNGGLNRDFVDNQRFSNVSSEMINFTFKYKKLDINVLYNNYEERLAFLGDAKLNVNGIFTYFNYRFDITSKLVLHTRLSIKDQNPYNFTDIPNAPPAFGGGRLTLLERTFTQDRRITGRAYFLYQPLENLNITTGAEVFADNSRYLLNRTFGNNKATVNYTNISAFAEGSFKSKFANITIGARVDKYTNIKPVVVPRIAITRAFEHLHFKAIYNEAFKTPTIQNIEFAANRAINPEKFRLTEFEVGYKFSSSLQLNANVYNILITDNIIRQDNVTVEAEYKNIGNSGTQGVEIDARYTKKWGYLHFGYSFYRVSELQPNQKLPLVSRVFSGVPAQKVTLQANFQFTPRISFAPTILYTTNKFRIASILFNPTDSEEYAPETLVNFNINYEDFLIKNVTLGIGAYNILDQTHWYLPWKIDFSSDLYLPAQGRELLVRLTYQFGN